MLNFFRLSVGFIEIIVEVGNCKVWYLGHYVQVSCVRLDVEFEM